MIVRELLGGAYFGQPRSIEGGGGCASCGQHHALLPNRKSSASPASVFDLAMKRRRKVLSVDKANVLECSRLWREVVTRIGKDYPDVKLAHQYVDSAGRGPCCWCSGRKDVDVLLTENMFGDILSDQAGGVVGSLGLLASASIGGPVGLSEPVHGSAPGHCRQRNSESAGGDSVGGDDAQAFVPVGDRSGKHRECGFNRAGARRADGGFGREVSCCNFHGRDGPPGC